MGDPVCPSRVQAFCHAVVRRDPAAILAFLSVMENKDLRAIFDDCPGGNHG
jgi:hypothetical protein